MNLEAVHLLVKVFLYLNSKRGGGGHVSVAEKPKNNYSG